MTDRLSARSAELPAPNDAEHIEVFISHASEDTELVWLIRNSLEHRGVRCWFDEERLKPGDDWDRLLREAIQGSKMCLVVLSKNAVDSDAWVSKEWSLIQATAWNRDDLAVLPLLVDDVNVPPFLRCWQSLRCESQPANVDRLCSEIIEHLRGTNLASARASSERDQTEAIQRFQRIFRTLQKAAASGSNKIRGSDE